MEIGAVAAGIAVTADVVGDNVVGSEVVGDDVAVGRGIGVDAAVDVVVDEVTMPVAVAAVSVGTTRVDVGAGCSSTAPSEQAMTDTAIATKSAIGSNRVKSIVDKINLHSLYSHRWR